MFTPLSSTEDQDHRESTPRTSSVGGIRGWRVYNDNLGRQYAGRRPHRVGSRNDYGLVGHSQDHRLRGKGKREFPCLSHGVQSRFDFLRKFRESQPPVLNAGLSPHTISPAMRGSLLRFFVRGRSWARMSQRRSWTKLDASALRKYKTRVPG